ncbi:unnamed protein product [Taenia asiatica]|uniref:ATE_C domain-containing protein n=1 Tax=Taenia asiatica TaxID=60517 RepID=A0A0R3W4P2_TAEAS|nr:unnamed protein product [Taenia asiatica]
MRKTINRKTCCPAYAIWCDAEQFRISRSQKKVLRNFNNFLYGRGKFEEATTSPATTACWEDRPVDAPSPKTNPEHTESHCGKAVQKRVGGKIKVSAAKRAKQECDIPATTRDEYQIRRQKRLDKNKPKDLEDYLRSEPREGEAAHFLDIRLYKCSPRSAEFEATLDEELKLYSAYQAAVCKEAPEDLTRDGFIKQLKLIAVGVLDLVPGGLSSVHFFYDTCYKFLRLSTYSALREIAFIRDLHRTFGSRVAAYADPMQYTLGSYVHSCAKMQYKTHFSPSRLICPDTYTMVPLQKCQRMLDEKRRYRFADAGVKKAPPVKRRKAVLLLPYSHSLVNRLPSCEFTIEDNVLITNVADGLALLNYFDIENVNEWLRLIPSTGAMRIDCSRSELPSS